MCIRDRDEAVARLSTCCYHVVVIDLCLGGDDGVRLLRSIQKTGADPTVIFVSGVDNRTRAAAFRIAADLGFRVAGTLSRPFDPGSLHSLLLLNPLHSPNKLRMSVAAPTSSQFKQALLDGEIRTEYQPKADLATGEVVGVEALARWRSPALGNISPEQFVPVAEGTYLINDLTFKVLRDAVAACRKWRESRPDFHVAVNISPLVLSDPRLLTEIDSLLADNGLPPGALVAEVTESSVLADMSLAREVLTRLSIKGVRVSMDDFGTGYSSLSSLLRIPFTELKIDRCFVGVCTTDAEAWKIVRATVSLARELGIKVVAEGIENEETSNRLRNLNCEIGQGWYFGRPMPADMISRRLAGSPPWAAMEEPVLTSHEAGGTDRRIWH